MAGLEEAFENIAKKRKKSPRIEPVAPPQYVPFPKAKKTTPKKKLTSPEQAVLESRYEQDFDEQLKSGDQILVADDFVMKNDTMNTLSYRSDIMNEGSPNELLLLTVNLGKKTTIGKFAYEYLTISVSDNSKVKDNKLFTVQIYARKDNLSKAVKQPAKSFFLAPEEDYPTLLFDRINDSDQFKYDPNAKPTEPTVVLLIKEQAILLTENTILIDETVKVGTHARFGGLNKNPKKAKNM